MSITTPNATALEIPLSRLRKMPGDPGATEEFLSLLRPVIETHAARYALTADTVQRIRRELERALVERLPEIVRRWFAKSEPDARPLWALVRRETARAVSRICLDPRGARLLADDDLKLEPLDAARADSPVRLRIYADALERARLQFEGRNGRAGRALAEHAVHTIAFHRVRPTWTRRNAEKWGGARAEVVMEVWSMAAQWVRAAVSKHISELIAAH